MMKFLGIVAGLGVVNSDIVIGVLSQPYFGSTATKAENDSRPEVRDGGSYIKVTVGKLVESGGGSAVPILYDMEDADLDNFIDRVDGIIFTGGPLITNSTSLSPFMKVAEKIYNKAKAEEIPLLAICQGFQIISRFITGNRKILGVHPSVRKFHSVDIKEDSKLAKHLGKSVLKTLREKPATTQSHNYGVGMDKAELFGLDKEFNIIATDVDDNGSVIANIIEHPTLPIWGTQFHPEVDPKAYSFNEPDDAVSFALRGFASHFVSQAWDYKFNKKGGRQGFTAQEIEENRFALGQDQSYFPIIATQSDVYFDQVAVFPKLAPKDFDGAMPEVWPEDDDYDSEEGEHPLDPVDDNADVPHVPVVMRM